MIEVKKWFEKALQDLETAEVNLENERFDAAAFYAHQATEKALKAEYIKQFKELWKIHDLVELAKKLGAPANVLKACDELNPHYIATRYPVDFQYDKDKANTAVENARIVIKWLEKARN